MSFLCKDTCKCQYAFTETQFSWNGLISDRGKRGAHLYPEDKTLLKPKSPLLKHPFGLTNRHPGANWPDGKLILFCEYLVYSTPFSSVHTDSLFFFTLKKKKKNSSPVLVLFFPISCTQLLSHVQLFMIPWTVDHQDPLSIGFPRQDDWSGLPFPLPGCLPDPGIKSKSPVSPPLAS